MSFKSFKFPLKVNLFIIYYEFIIYYDFIIYSIYFELLLSDLILTDYLHFFGYYL